MATPRPRVVGTTQKVQYFAASITVTKAFSRCPPRAALI
jgi:hypothetical protein